MPTYRITQREIHESTFEVEADNLANAIEQVWGGEADVLNVEFMEVDESNGISMYDHSISPEDRMLLIEQNIVNDWEVELKGISKIEKLT
jgi:hypothetical protein